MNFKQDELNQLQPEAMIELVLSLQEQNKALQAELTQQGNSSPIDLQHLRHDPIQGLIIATMILGLGLIYYSVWDVLATELTSRIYFWVGLVTLALNWGAFQLHRTKKIEMAGLLTLGSLILISNAALLVPNSWESFAPYITLPIIVVSGLLIIPDATIFIALVSVFTNLATVVAYMGLDWKILNHFIMPGFFSLITALTVVISIGNLLGAFKWALQSQHKTRQRGDELFATQRLLQKTNKLLESQAVELHQRQKAAEEARELAETATKQALTALHETEVLFKAAQSILGAKDLETICQNLVIHFNELIPSLTSSLYLVDHERSEVIFAVDDDPATAIQPRTYDELTQGISGLVFNAKRPIISSHADDGIEPEATKIKRKENGDVSLMVVPLINQGQVIGTITCSRLIDQPPFVQHDVDLLMALTTQAAAAIQNIRLFKAAQEAKEVVEGAIKQTQVALYETEGLFKAAQSILGANDLETICHNLVTHFKDLTASTAMSFYLVDHEQRRVVLAVERHSSVFIEMDDVSYNKLELGIAGLVFKLKQPILSLHADDGIEPAATKEIRKARGVGSIIVAPLMTQGQIIGIITPVRTIGEPDFTQHDVDLLMALTTQAAAAIENVRLFKAAQEARDAAEKANKAKSVFLANMSHELRTPLNAVLGFSQLMRRDPQITLNQMEKLRIINRSGEHLLNLINDVLEISKIEAGKIILHNLAFNLHDLLADIETMFRLRTQEKKLILQLERAADVPAHLRADVGKLRQIIINLLGNAVKFTSTGSVTLRVTVAETSEFTETSEAWVRLHFAVEDTGYGISEAELGQLFETFVQTESGRNSQQGTGLGLALSRQFVRLMGGDLTARSQIGVGSCFEFDFKATVLDAHEVLQPEMRRVIGLAVGQERYRVLVVDDKVDNRELLRQILSPLGFEVQEAENGLEALAVWEIWQPHYILLDIRMPVMDGYETTRQLRARGAKTVIIAVTASAFEEERSVVLTVGCDDFMRKPIREELLLDLLAQHGGVQYLYEEAAIETLPDLSEASAVAIPVEWLAQLHDAAIAGSYGVLIELATQIKGLDESTGLQLLRWIDDFEYNQILEWVASQQILDTP